MKKMIGILVAFFGLFLFASPAFAASVIYNNVDPAPSSVPSLGYEATSTSEFGGQVEFAGTDRYSPTITVLMVSWACESGNWYDHDCLTTGGATFSHPVTLNVYIVNPDNSVGPLVVSKTESFDMPYRPSADNTNCTGADEGKWHDGSQCNNGYAFPISFDFDGTTLPNKVIIGVAYNTSHYGASPLGTTGPYDSLNVGTEPTPSVGTSLPSVDDAYLNSNWGGAYCDSGLGTGTFRLDAGCWTGYLPAFKVEASPFPIIASVNGGGHLLEETYKRKDWKDVSFGGWVNKYLDNSLAADFTVVLHKVGKSTLDKSTFYGTDITAVNFFNGDGVTCNDAVNFTINGTFNGVPGYSIIFRAGDYGSPNTLDTARVTIYKGLNGGGDVVYDTAGGDFPSDPSSCVGTARTGLDTGNITIDW